MHSPVINLEDVRVLLLTWHGTAILPVLRSLGPEVSRIVVLHGLPNDVVAKSVYARPFIRFEAEVPDSALCEEVRRVASLFGCSVLFPADDLAVEFTSRNAAVLSQSITVAPSPSAAMLERIRCKVAFTRQLSELGLDHPRSAQGDTPRSLLADTLTRLRPPWMVKASCRSGGQGIFRCETPAELTGACEQLAAEGARFLVQEFVPGPDADCSFLAVNGKVLAATTQHSIAKGRDYAPATEIRLHPHPPLRGMAERLAAALGWNGLAHLDAVQDERDGSYKLLELNARCWGSLLASTAAGVNFPKLLIESALGRRVEEPPLRAGRFYMGGLGIRRALGLDGPKWGMRETDVPYFLEDPWPEIQAWWNARGH